MSVTTTGVGKQRARWTVGLAMALTVALGVVLGGCFHPLHEPPNRGQPAATVKFRISHVPRPTGALSFGLLIDSRRLIHHPPRQGPSATWTRVKPGWRVLSLRTMFYVRRSYQQAYTSYSSYKCGKSTCSRSQTRYRTAYRTVPTGVCKRSLAVYVRNAETYLFGYSYLGHGSCNLTCHRQVHSGGGRFRLLPCAHTRAVSND